MAADNMVLRLQDQGRIIQRCVKRYTDLEKSCVKKGRSGLIEEESKENLFFEEKDEQK